MDKYIGRIVDIIYLDRHNKLSQRRIRVQSVQGEQLRAYDYDRQAPRVFKIDSILAVQLVRSA